MRFFKGMFRSIRFHFGAAAKYPVSLSHGSDDGRPRVLLSYQSEPVLWPDDHPKMLTHSSYWESREIARILFSFGYDVDVVNWDDFSFWPQRDYDIVLDIDANLQRWAPILGNNTLKLMYLTGSYGPFQHHMELSRVAAFEKKTGKLYSPKRLLRWLELTERSLRIADQCLLIGNEVTQNTYPEEYRAKISCVTVSASSLTRVRSEDQMCPSRRHFLWFFGAGAVLKGLDLLLDVVQQHPEWNLHIIGKPRKERDFMLAYGDHLQSPNIHAHGYISSGSPIFLDKLKDIFCFVAPSGSEGISPSVATCLQVGIFPIISRNTGVSLPPGCGIYLDDLSINAVELAMRTAYDLDDREIIHQTNLCQQMAMAKYSREAFHQTYRQALCSLELVALGKNYVETRGHAGHN